MPATALLLALQCPVHADCQTAYPPHGKIPASKHHPIVIAHRGDHVNLPENTLAAYRSAIEIGADYVEIDLRTTKDSGLVSLHNESVDRMTGSHGNVRDLDLATIRSLKVQGTEQIPTFQEILALCKGRINIYLDFKEADPGAAYRLIKQYGMERHIIVYANTASQLAEWVRIAPEMPLISNAGDAKDSVSLGALLRQHPISAFDGSPSEYTPEMLSFLKERKVAIWPDVQSKEEGPASWQKALDINVQGMQTDHPAALIAWLRSKGLR